MAQIKTQIEDAGRRDIDRAMLRFIGGSVVILYVAVQWFLLTNSVHQDMREIVMRSLGTLDAAVGLVLGYYFGRSASESGVSTPQITTIAQTPPATVSRLGE